MTAFYNFLTVHRPPPHAMAPALAGALGVKTRDVDVATEYTEETGGRNWDAPVLCTCDSVTGDLALSWDVSVSDAVATPPAEAEAALRLAARLGTTVLYPAQERPPSAYWAAGPDGTVARARLLEAAGTSDDTSDGGGPPALVVDAVEAAMEQLPTARVEVLAEILHEERVDTPVTDAFAAATDPQGVAPAADPVNRAREALSLWERMVRRADAGWAPGGRYPFEQYAEDLRTRDRLEELAGTGGPEHERLVRAVAELDEMFRRSTDHDSGALLGNLTGSGSEVAGRGWWWHRRPAEPPWDR
ncbi:hypothetical protein ACIREO_38460 [Streptomyces sp. NPDC102441]|uniref:hypothetical protein n=1 Tax=Streptomyces sp. NPDC102441 TaxID=3366176 RepID=UPI00381B4D22